MAMEQETNGAGILDINMGMNGIDEKEMMKSVIYEVSSTVDCPLCIDSSYVEVIEEALKIYPGRALINSISLETEKMENYCLLRQNTERCSYFYRFRMQVCRRMSRKKADYKYYL